MFILHQHAMLNIAIFKCVAGVTTAAAMQTRALVSVTGIKSLQSLR